MRLIQTTPHSTNIAKKLTKVESGTTPIAILDEKDTRMIHFYDEASQEPRLLSTYNRSNGDLVVY